MKRVRPFRTAASRGRPPVLFLTLPGEPGPIVPSFGTSDPWIPACAGKRQSGSGHVHVSKDAPPALQPPASICYRSAIMALTLYNSLTRRKEEFRPLDPRNVR